MKRVITAEVVASEFEAGRRCIAAPRAEAVITPAAWSKGRELGVTFDQSATTATTPQQACCERVKDPSGLVVVRGNTVRLGKFAGAGPDRNVGLSDLITGGDGSPMTAGIMSWGREDSFPWTLDYDEVDLVLEGVLHITIDGRVLEGKPGDVFYIPKGSRIVFGTPRRTRVFYVTYPADWAAASGAPARPQK
ncbi:MAG: cupin domain-containing protein [Myxococcaceae bacterium]